MWLICEVLRIYNCNAKCSLMSLFFFIPELVLFDWRSKFLNARLKLVIELAREKFDDALMIWKCLIWRTNKKKQMRLIAVPHTAYRIKNDRRSSWSTARKFPWKRLTTMWCLSHMLLYIHYTEFSVSNLYYICICADFLRNELLLAVLHANLTLRFICEL